MDIQNTTRALAALAQESRLRAFRMLVSEGPAGIAAGKIADALDVPHNTMSTHLATLVNAGLVRSRRESRSIIYSIDFDGTRAMLSFLMEDCCQGNPDICLPVLENLVTGCCAPNPSTGAHT